MTQTSQWPSQPGEEQSAGSAQDKATQVAQSAKDSGAEVAQTAAEQAKSVAAEASHQARDLLQEARGQVREQAGSQQQRVVAGLQALAEELHAMTQNSGQSGPASEVAHQAGERARRAADWLEQREPGDLLTELRRLGRRRPGAFLAGAALAGVLAGRLTRGVAANSNDEPTSSEQRSVPAPGPQGTDPQPTWPAADATVTQALYAPGVPGYAPGVPGYAPDAPIGAAQVVYPPGPGGGPTYGAAGTYPPPVDPASGPGVLP